MAVIRITEFTDPMCPFAWSAEPVRRALQWRYGAELSWSTKLVGLAETRQDYVDKGFTPDKLSEGYRALAESHGMPMDTSERTAVSATVPACRAVVAARLRAPEVGRAVLRALQVRNFSGQLLDDPRTLTAAAQDAGLDAPTFEAWLKDPEVERELRADLQAARTPSHAASALPHKLAAWSGGLRYTCPSYEFERTVAPDERISVPGFQPLAASEIAVANLAPALDRTPASTDVDEVLRWAGEPLATAEVAAICETDLAATRQLLSRVAEERPVGQDGLWSLA